MPLSRRGKRYVIRPNLDAFLAPGTPHPWEHCFGIAACYFGGSSIVLAKIDLFDANGVSQFVNHFSTIWLYAHTLNNELSRK